MQKLGANAFDELDGILRKAGEKPRKQIKLKEIAPKLMVAGGPAKTAVLLEAVVVKASQLSDHFLRYETNNSNSNAFVQRSGDVLLLLFRKDLTNDLFAALRSADMKTVAYYRGARGEPFDVVVEASNGR